MGKFDEGRRAELRERLCRYFAEVDWYCTCLEAYNSRVGLCIDFFSKSRARSGAEPAVAVARGTNPLDLLATTAAVQASMEKDQNDLKDHRNRLNRERLLLLSEMEAIRALNVRTI